MSDQIAEQTAEQAEENATPTILGRIWKMARGMAAMAIWSAAAFAGAGRIDWVRGWVCAGVYVLAMLVTGWLVHRFNPGLLKARAQGVRKDTVWFDKIFMRIFVPLAFIQFLVAGMDAVRFRAMPMAPWTMAPGIALFLVAVATVAWTLLVNPFAETTIRIQSDRGHAVISSGPYRFVRHPMYVGSILMYPATALMFGSGWAMAIGLVIALLLVWRTAKEDRFLQSNLTGYREFSTRTRYRLVPGLW